MDIEKYWGSCIGGTDDSLTLLDHLNHAFRIAAAENVSDEETVASVIAFSEIVVPSEYLNLIRKYSELEFMVSDIRTIRIWGADGCIEMNKAYHIQKYIPQSLAIGDDEGGNALIYATGCEGFGVYAVAFNDLEIDEMKYISDSLVSLFVNGKDVQALVNL